MITIKTLTNKLIEKQQFDDEFKALIKDTNAPLKERWDLFKFAVENNVFINPCPFYLDLEILESKPNFCWYDMGFSEGSDVNLVGIITNFEEELNKDWEVLNWVLKTQEEVDELKEVILSQGYTSFYYD